MIFSNFCFSRELSRICEVRLTPKMISAKMCIRDRVYTIGASVSINAGPRIIAVVVRGQKRPQ